MIVLEVGLNHLGSESNAQYYVDYFINNDVLLLKHTLKQLLKNTVKKKVLTNSEDKKNIFNKKETYKFVKSKYSK